MIDTISPLEVEILLITAVLLEEALMIPLFHNAALFDEDNLVGIHDRRKTLEVGGKFYLSGQDPCLQ